MEVPRFRLFIKCQDQVGVVCINSQTARLVPYGALGTERLEALSIIRMRYGQEAIPSYLTG